MTMQPAFPKISKIKYEGPTSKNPLAFKHSNASGRQEFLENLINEFV